MRHPDAPVTVWEMRRARFYLTLLALTLLPQVLAATDLVRWLQACEITWLSLSVPGLLLLLNVPMAFEVLRRKRKARLPRALAAAVQTPWTAWWLGSIFYALLLLFWGAGALVARLFGADAQMPLWVALSPFALSLYGTLFGAHALRRERVEVPVAGLPPGWHGARIVQLSDLHSGRHVTAERLRRIARRAAGRKAPPPCCSPTSRTLGRSRRRPACTCSSPATRTEGRWRCCGCTGR